MSLLNSENNNFAGIAVLRIRNSFTSQNAKVFKKEAKTFYKRNNPVLSDIILRKVLILC